MSGRPLDVLEASVGESVMVRLKDGEEIEGTLSGYDQHLNVVLDDVGPEDNTTIIRGDNVVVINP